MVVVVLVYIVFVGSGNNGTTIVMVVNKQWWWTSSDNERVATMRSRKCFENATYGLNGGGIDGGDHLYINCDPL